MVADTIQTDATIYPSGMLVAHVIPTKEESQNLGYTKHYYAGTQRVSSKIGTTENLGDFLQDWYTGGIGGPVDVVGSSNGVLANAEEGVVQVYEELEMTPPTFDSNPVFIPVQGFTHGAQEIENYWFHPDHLGSSSYITNFVGEVSQHMEYFAFGETFVEEHRSSNNSPYKFNGKELDEETGWYYYGARYYDARTSVWLSVDPLVYDGTFMDGAHNNGFYNSFNHGSYIYCYQNPLNLIDPNGKQTVARIHTMNGSTHLGTIDIEYYKMTKQEIKHAGGEFRGSGGGYLAASHGPQGEGVLHIYLQINPNYKGDKYKGTRWDFQQDATRHGLYSGAGSITDYAGRDDFSFQPVDWADAIAKRHDMDYFNKAVKYGNYAGFVEDVRTLNADIRMVNRVKSLLLSPTGTFTDKGLETPFFTGSTIEMQLGARGQYTAIGLFADYKSWKVRNKLTNEHKITNGNFQGYGNDNGLVKAALIHKAESDRAASE